jgi:hypothetical protein
MRIASVTALVLFAVACGAIGCATYKDELARGQTAYEGNHHEQALAIFRGLENDQSHFDPAERARYAYLRGMTDFRIGYRADARHWLGVAKEIDGQNKSALPEQWKSRLETTLADLNESVWSGGTLSLDKPVSKDKSDKTDKTDKPEKSKEDKDKD